MLRGLPARRRPATAWLSSAPSTAASTPSHSDPGRYFAPARGELDALDTLLALGQELELDVVRVHQVHGESVDVRRVRGVQVGDVDKLEADDVRGGVDAGRLEPGLVPCSTIMRHANRAVAHDRRDEIDECAHLRRGEQT